MSKFTYLVTVETERDSGLIASRDEQSERISTEIENVIDSADLSGIGARSDSDYFVVGVEIWEMSKSDEKEVNEQYEREVRAAEPSDKELRDELRVAKESEARYKSLFEQTKDNLDRVLKSPEFSETRIFQEERSGLVRVRRYFADGRYDPVHFLPSEGGDDTITVRMEEDGDLEVRYNGMGKELMVLPRSGNEFVIRTERRTRR